MSKIPAEIGRRIRALRQARKLTQAQVAEAVGIDPSFYGQVERGTNTPSLKTFLAVADVLEVDPAELLPSRKRGSGKDPYPEILSRLVSDLTPKRREFVLSVLRDLVAEFKSKE